MKDKSNINQRILNSFYAKLGAIIHKYDLISEDDSILVGVSGGIDSASLLSALATRRKFGKHNYKLIAAYIKVENLDYDIDISWLKDFCNNLDTELIIQSIEVDFTKAQNKAYCYYCSTQKRKALFALAETNKVRKIALGHHLDDALETLFLNMFYHGSISSMPAKLELFNGKMSLIRPLIEFTKNDISEIAKILKIRKVIKNCPHEDYTARKKASKLIAKIEKDFGVSRQTIFNSMSNIFPDYLPGNRKV